MSAIALIFLTYVTIGVFRGITWALLSWRLGKWPLDLGFWRTLLWRSATWPLW